MSAIKIISASAGSGKTYRLTGELEEAVRSDTARPEAVVATTFTNRAAAELAERVRVRLISAGQLQEAQRLGAARIGTVNSVCSRLVADHALELGLSPRLEVLDESAAESSLAASLSSVVTPEIHRELEGLRRRMGSVEWIKEVKSIVQLARCNGVEPDALRSAAAKSTETFSPLLGDAVAKDEDLDGELLEALEEFIDEVEAGDDCTKKTAAVLATARACRGVLRSGRPLSWVDWVRLSKVDVAVKSRGAAAALLAIAGRYDQHPGLHGDVSRWIELVYQCAAEGLESYAAFKRSRGVIDFADQEALALSLLEQPEVRGRLKGQIDLLLVDEFQDTSPIQLAIFLRLADCAERTVWVGDQKQSIFGFRGTDPAIMDAAVETILGGAEPETLTESWRSRAELVRVTSELFARAFAAVDIPEGRVRLEPAAELGAEAQDLGPVLERWVLRSKNAGMDAACLAAGVKEALSDPEVRVREEDGTSRRVRPGDMAVLCRTNDTCSEVATALEGLDIPTVLARPGLLRTSEAQVSLAALRLLVDPQDSLARATLGRFLDSPEDEEGWLTRLLEQPYAKAFADLEAVRRLREAREQSPPPGALAALDAAMAAVDLRELCLGWGDSARRLANLDRLRAHAADYCAEAVSGAGGPTATGLLHYLEALPDENADMQAAVATENAVTVSTLHKAKGLEWPVVVLFELQKTYPGRALGVTVASERESFDLDDPLAGRWIRYWPYPFGNHSKGVSLNGRLAGHKQQLLAEKQQRRQELRLLYVAWTRARDRLILATRPNKISKGILGLLEDDAGALLAEPDETTTWAGETFKVRLRDLEPMEFVEPAIKPGSAPVPSGPRPYPPARVSPSGMTARGKLGDPIILGEPIPVTGKRDPEALGEAIHGFFAADRPELEQATRLELASGLLSRWKVTGSVEAGQLLVSSDRLCSWAEKSHPGATWRGEWPIMQRTDEGSEVRGYIDLVLECDDHLVLLDHKSLNRLDPKDMEHTESFAGQLQAYARALEAATGKPVRGSYIHLPLGGQVVPISWSAVKDGGGE